MMEAASPPTKLRSLRKQANLTLDQLAQRARTTKSQVHKLERGERRLTVDWIMRLSKALNCEPQQLLPQTAGQTMAHRVASNDDRSAHALDLPVKGTIGSYQGDGLFRADVVEHVSRPFFLRGASDAFAVYVGDESMQPRYYPGDLLYIKPGVPVTEKTSVLVTLKQGVPFVAHVLKISPGGLELQKLNPLRTLHVQREDIGTMARIVGVYQG